MPTFVTIGANGELTASSDFSFSPDCVEVSFEVVRGLDGRLYRDGEVPTPPLAEVQAAKRREINAGFDAALAASLTMPSRDTPPSVVELAIAIADFRVDDPTGLTDLQAIHEARRTSLLAAVDAANSVEAVQVISVTYAV